MNKILALLILSTLCCSNISATKPSDNDRIRTLEEKYSIINDNQVKAENDLLKLTEEQGESERKIEFLKKDNKAQQLAIDSLRNTCSILEKAQTADRKDINGKIDATDNNVRVNQNMLQSRTLWGIMIVIILLALVTTGSYLLAKRIKSGDTSIDEVRKAQGALEVAQKKMQEESIKLDNQMLAIVQKQLDAYIPSANKTTGEPDHSLVVKLADEIARIETNLSKMDKSVRGYKQLVQAKDRMINNVRANGYEIISLLGQEYNDGMQFQTRFVPDESLPEGKRIITGMIKMQVNYNGKMIQPAEIVVSQNI